MNNGIAAVLQKIKFLLYPYLVLLSACLMLKAFYSKETIYYTVNSWHFTFGDTIFPYITDLGDGIVVVIISLLVLAFNYRKGFLLASSYALTSVVAQIIKHIFNSPRPLLYFAADTSKMYLIKGVEMFHNASMPSGHSTSAFSAAVVLTYVTPKKYYGLLFLLLAILVGYSRMYLSEHFFEDVVAGSALGVFCTSLWISYIDSKAFIHSAKWDKGLLSTIRSKK